jgi:REP element-mobilizing transposase RayT
VRDYRYRRATRSRLHDYSRPGAYVVTVCTFDREVIFGTIVDGLMNMNRSGRIVERCWQQLPRRFGSVSLDAFVVMPNHVHGIIVLNSIDESLPTLHKVVGAFKASAARRINNDRGVNGVPVWQRSFHDQIIRDDQHLDNVRAYINANPTCWLYDEENPSAINNA